MANKKQIDYGIKFIKEKYDQIIIRIPKGERDRYKSLAARLGLSVNQLFVQAVEQYIADNIDVLGEPSAPSATDISDLNRGDNL